MDGQPSSKNAADLLDDVDLFSTSPGNDPHFAAVNSFGNRSARSNSLIDAPIPAVKTDKLIDWSDFELSPPPPIRHSSTTNFVEQWPEVPSVNVEHRVSSTGSASSQKDLMSLSSIQNGPPLSLTPMANGFFNRNGGFGISPSPSKDLFRCDSAPEQSGIGGNRFQKSPSTTGLAVPPRIQQRKTALHSAPPVVSNGFAFSGSDESSVRYHRLSSTASKAEGRDGFDSYAPTEYTRSSVDQTSEKESKDLDDDDESEEDEVFLNIGSAGERASVLAPLTGIRKKKVRFFEDGITESELLVGSLPPSSNSGAVSLRKGRAWRPRLISLTLTSAVLLALGATVLIIIYAPWKSRPSENLKRVPASVRRSNRACTSINVEYVGNVSMDNVYPTSALTSMCTTGRDCKDTIVFGFGSTVAVPCYGSSECRGGVVAISASTGDSVWRFSALGEVNGVNCHDDLNGDGTNDCLASGKHGVLLALDGKTGELLWEAGKGQLESEFFMPQVVPDMDNDGVPEVLATMVNGAEDYMRLYFLSGKTGRPYLERTSYVLNLKNIETVVPSMIWKHGEGMSDVVISAGSFSRRGGVYDYALQSFLLMRLDKGRLIYNSSVLTPPVFADVNGDSFGDMIFCTVTGELLAIDGGAVGNVLWTFKAPHGQCASPLVIGFYNSDSSPDIAATFCFGDAFPNFRYCQTVFIDGRMGQELKGAAVHSLLPSVIAGLSIRTNSNAGDVFMIWNTTCGGAEARIDYRFVDAAPSGWRGYGWSNICLQLFGRRATHQLLAIGAGFASPTVIFDSSMRNFEDELEKFAAALEQVEPGLGYFMGKRKVALLQIGPAGTFVMSKSNGAVVADLVLPTFVSVASAIGIVPAGCQNSDDPGRCNSQFDLVAQPRPRPASADFSGGMLLHKLRLRCSCTSSGGSEVKCAEFIPDDRYQPWAEYLGSNADGRFLF